MAVGLALLAVAAAPSRADAQRTLGTIGKDFGNGFADIFHVWTSPVRADSKDWLTALGVVGVAAAFIPLDREINDIFVRNSESAVLNPLKPFREESNVEWIGDLGTLKIIHPITAGVYVVGFAADSRALRDGAMGCAAAGEANSVPRHLIYETVTRKRPYVSPDNQHTFRAGGGPWEDHSFFGGHAANAMACARFLGRRFELGVAEPLIYATAGTIAIARMADGRHWMSDNILGMVYGYAIGQQVANRQLKRLRKERAGDSSRSTTSGDGLQGAAYVAPGSKGGVVLGWKGSF